MPFKFSFSMLNTLERELQDPHYMKLPFVLPNQFQCLCQSSTGDGRSTGRRQGQKVAMVGKLLRNTSISSHCLSAIPLWEPPTESFCHKHLMSSWLSQNKIESYSKVTQIVHDPDTHTLTLHLRLYLFLILCPSPIPLTLVLLFLKYFQPLLPEGSLCTLSWSSLLPGIEIY